MSRGCGYCGVSGHDVTVCPERLEEYHGLPSDQIDDEEPEKATDGGVIDFRETEQASIQDFRTALELRNEKMEEIESDDRPEWEPRETNNPDTGARVQCDCGETVSKDFARVFGDNKNNVSACIHCSSYREIAGNEIRYGGGIGK